DVHPPRANLLEPRVRRVGRSRRVSRADAEGARGAGVGRRFGRSPRSARNRIRPRRRRRAGPVQRDATAVQRLMLRKVDRVLLRVASLPSAVAYYRDVLGLKLVRHEGKVASFSLGEGGTELVLHDDPDLPGEATYYLV